MLVFELWKKILIFTISFLALFFCLPNFFDKDSSEELPAFLNSKQIRLGLDLQGGSYLLLKVEIGAIKKERLNNLADEDDEIMNRLWTLKTAIHPIPGYPADELGNPDG